MKNIFKLSKYYFRHFRQMSMLKFKNFKFEIPTETMKLLENSRNKWR
jgi:hypothetical protein